MQTATLCFGPQRRSYIQFDIDDIPDLDLVGSGDVVLLLDRASTTGGKSEYDGLDNLAGFICHKMKILHSEISVGEATISPHFFI
ncbi:unnamed protein product [Hermetia illucens]|uniref:Uncharacterized protein n=1 Tax=Hermetia illucens TaxID=343691 RepID=A0A7R8UBX6_HERIL|nr:unnamed protein product [Hermetia illucens]